MIAPRSIRIEAKEDEVEGFLKDALDAVREEDKTIKISLAILQGSTLEPSLLTATMFAMGQNLLTREFQNERPTS